MDLGLDLIANPSKIKKRTYLANKKEGFDINEFILETVIDELNINTLIVKNGYTIWTICCTEIRYYGKFWGWTTF